jgi:serine/threonine-protein kinase
MVLRLDEGERRPQPLVQTPFYEGNGEISPDGRWLAYESNESGRMEIYVRPFPKVDDARSQVSSEGGARPLWARNGKELFYVTPDGNTLMTVEVSSGPTFRKGTPQKLLDTRRYFFPVALGNTGNAGRTYDVSDDGRFLVVRATAEEPGGEPAAPPSITVVLNWLEELKRLVPTN